MPKNTPDRIIDSGYAQVKRTSALPGSAGATINAGLTTLQVQDLIDTSLVNHRAESDPHSVYLTQTEGDALYSPLVHIHDDRYYTKSQLDSGQLDARYYTESEADSRFALKTRNVLAGSGLSGGGDLSADRTISLGTPGSLSSTSVNSASGTTHSHVIDSSIARSAITISVSGLGLSGGGDLTASRTIALASSSAPGAAASILASSAGGQLTLPLFVASTSMSTPTLITAAGDLTITPAGSNVAIASGKTVRSSYTSGWAGAGYQIDYNVTNASKSFLELDDISVRGTLNVYELLVNQIRATNGTEIVSSVAKLASVSGSTWTFENADGANLCPFAVGDILLIQRATVAAGTLIKRIVRKVATVTGASITVGTATGGPADTGSPAKGDTVVRIGSETDANRRGSILLTSDMASAPFIDVISGVDLWSAWGGTAKTKLRLGLLTGITGTANEYGLIAGSGFTATDSYIKLSTSAVVQNNVDSYWKIGGVDNVRINSANGLNVKAASASTYPNPVASGVSWWASTLGSGTQVAQVGASTDGVYGSNLWLSAYQTATFGGAVKITATGTDTSYSQFQVAGSSAGFGGNIYGKVNSTGYLLFQVGTKEMFYNANGLYVGPNGASKSKIYITDTWGNHPSDSGELNAEIANDVATYNALMIAGNKAADGTNRQVNIYDKLFVPTIIEIGQDRVSGNLSQATIRHSTYAALSLASTVWGYASHIGFNAYMADRSGAYNASGAWKYLGAQYIGNITAPGMLSFDGNSNRFTFYIGEAGLSSGADITTWSNIFNINRGNFDSNVRGAIRQASATGAASALDLQQSDLSEEFVNFISTVGAGNAIDTAAIGTYYGKIRVSVNGTFKYIALYNS